MSSELTPFEKIRHNREDGTEYWSARELAKILGYTRWERFPTVLKKASQACATTAEKVSDHFRVTSKMVKLGSGASRSLEDYELSRFACYLVVENADPSKPVVALGQTYFATQTRRAELQEESRRTFIYDELTERTELLRETVAGLAGIVHAKDFAIFQDYGYKGLYNGETAAEIHKRKGLKPDQNILDHMSKSELAANLFKVAQADDAIVGRGVISQEEANRINQQARRITRKAIAEMGNRMPETVPNPTDSIKIAKKRQKALKEIEKLKKFAETERKEEAE